MRPLRCAIFLATVLLLSVYPVTVSAQDTNAKSGKGGGGITGMPGGGCDTDFAAKPGGGCDTSSDKDLDPLGERRGVQSKPPSKRPDTDEKEKRPAREREREKDKQ